MAERPKKKPVKVGVKKGGGPPPGYEWNLDILDVANEEMMAALPNEEQHEHMRDQFRELARHKQPTVSETLDIVAVENFYELRDWNGPLGKLSVRAFWGLCKKKRTIIVLGLVLKKSQKTPKGTKELMAVRLGRYLKEHCR